VSGRAAEVAWIDAHVERTGDVEEVRSRPWATVLRVPTMEGPVWMKLPGPQTRFEVPLYGLLARRVPERVLIPIAADVERGWLLLPDGGPHADLDGLPAALGTYGRLQRELAGDVAEMLALGVPDMRPEVMPERFQEALAAVGGNAEVEAMAPQVDEWCARLAASPVPAGLDHNDLHHENVLGGGRFYDWGDSVVAHAFAVALVPLGMLLRHRGEDAMRRARDAYLEAFADLGPRDALAETLVAACRVAKIARTLTWVRAAPGESAAAQQLATLLEESHV
jgi:hypothetical protein